MKKRILSMLLALAMVLSLLPTAVWADDTAAQAVPECICTEACTADSWNPDCPVCSAETAVPEDCGCYIPPQEAEAAPMEAATECICTEACTADSWNPDCPVCSADTAVPEDCGCYEPQQDEAQQPEEAAPECVCTEACTAEAWNPDCPVCSASDATPEDCGCYIPDDMALTEEEQRLLEADQSTLSLDQQAALLDAMVKAQALSGEYAVAVQDGEGEAGFTFLISTAEQLHDLALKVNNRERYSGGRWSSASYRQVGNLDLSAYAEGEGWTPIGTFDYAFQGTYDGSGFSITGLTINRSIVYQGLFGCIEGAVIQNVHIVDCTIKGYDTVGALVGAAYTSANTITGCSASGIVSGEGDNGQCIGGIAGFFSGKVNASFSMCVVSGKSFVGGIVGQADGGLVGSLVENCWSSGSVSAATKIAGGIVGNNINDAVVKYCYSTATVSAPAYAGGIVGQAMGRVEYCAALNPSVTGDANHVAAVDPAYEGSIASCYAWDGMTINGSTADLPEGVTALTFTGGTLNHQLSEIFGASEVWTFEDNKLPGFGVTYDLPDYMTAEPVEPEQIIEIDSADKLAALAAGVNTGAEFTMDGKTISAGGEGWTFVQTTNIDLSGYASGEGWTTIGLNKYTGKTFRGTYDGGGYQITNLYIKRADAYQGLFGCINNAVIKNVQIVDCSVQGYQLTGALAGSANGSTIYGCFVSGTVTGSSAGVGGIIGSTYGTRVEACSSTCSVRSETLVGGIIGNADSSSSVVNCWTSGSVNSNANYAGGIAGYNLNGSVVKYCYSTATVYAKSYAGGITGRTNSEVAYCAALNQSVSGSSNVSCITTGSNQNCYAWADMTGIGASIPEGVTPITVTNGTLNYQLSVVFGPSEVWTYADNMLPDFGTAYALPDYMTTTKAQTILISSAEDLNSLAIGINSGVDFAMSDYTIPAGGEGWTFLQTCDIDLSGYSDWTPIGQSGGFAGIYDGGGFQITGLTVNSAENYIGLFSYVSGTIENVHVVNCSVQGAAYVGAIAGYLTSTGSITGCSASGMVAGTGEGIGIENGIGGIAGFASGRISMCSADCTVSGASHIGGIVGYSTGMIASCHSSGYVTASTSNAGGIGGTAENTIQNCYSTAAVYGLNSVGGIAGGGSAAVKNCVALNSSVTGENNVQYIVERGDNTAQNSYVWANLTVTNSYGQVTCISDTITISEGTLSTQFSEIFDGNMVWTYADNQLPGLWGGTYDLPYYIASNLPASTVTVDSAEELKALADGINDGQAFMFKGMRITPYGKGWTFLQTSNIDLSQYSEGTGWAPIGPYGFDGTYDGQDHAITGLTINNRSASDIGLFSRNHGTIQNLSVEGGKVAGFEWTGGIVGENSGTIENVHMTGCDIQGNSFTGGIAGLSVGIVRNCSVTGVIDAGGVDGNSGAVGGIVGYNVTSSLIEQCYSAAKIYNSKASEASAYGGICGANNGTIKNCWSLSTVSGPSMVSGLVGSNTRGSILQCAALGSSVSYTNSAGAGGRITYAEASTGPIEQVYAWSGMPVNGTTLEGQQDPCESGTAPYAIGELYVCDGYVYTDKLCTTRLDWSAFGMTEENGWQDTDTAGYLPTRKGAPQIVLDLPQQDSPRPDVNVTVTLTNLTTDFTESTAKQGVALTMTLTPDAYYLLPETVEVTVGSTELTAGTDYTYDSATGLLTIPAASVSGDVTVISAAVPQTFAVTLNLGGGEIEAGKELTSYTYTVGAVLPTAITRTGYTFAGWFETEDFSGSAVTEITTTDTGDKTYYAKWTANDYKVILNLNGGEIEAGKELTSYTYAIGAVLPTAITRTGYTFAGWFENEDFSGKAVTEITKTDLGNKTYYAKWTANDYKVTLNTNGGTIAAGAELSGYVYAVGAVLPTAITRTGYTFAGWFETKDFTGKAVTEITNTDLGDKTYYAKWAANDYKVTLNTNGGTIAAGSELSGYVYGYGAALPTAITRTGYTFAGWFETEDFSGKAVTEITKTDLGDKTYYAKWTANDYKVTLNLGGGTIAAGAELSGYVYGYGAVLPTAITRTGYTFAGWFESKDLSGKAVTEITKTDLGDKTYYAKWDIVTYDILYALEGGTNAAANPSSYTVADTLTLTAPVREGYTFTGWTWEGQPEPKLTVQVPAGTTGTLRFTAHWQENEQPPIRFIDVAEDDWFYDPVYWAVETGITTGTTDTTFSPKDDCTRAHMVTFLWRAAGSPEPNITENPFTDVSEGSCYYKAILWAVEHGITKGTSKSTFSPNAPCTRAQIVTFLWRYAGAPKAQEGGSAFLDLRQGSYYEEAVLWAAQQGIAKGVTGTIFRPNGTCTRAQGVTFLYRFFHA